jgi:2-succinyl-5-enolpyruvyl-6-hydroxy-3-cyclohexene-1-carboxylate synthase
VTEPSINQDKPPAPYLDPRNTNSLWASVLVETLVQLGLRLAVVCPGSRSTPFTLALALHPQVEAVPVLDERSGSFFALGVAKASGEPVVLVCTSGTAGANFYPAIIEAKESQVPLLVLTADRPPELRDCASGQTIDQQKLFGDYVNWYSELALPAADLGQLRYLRQTMQQAWRCCLRPSPGPVHVNCPVRDPLPPIADGTAEATATAIDLDQFWSHLTPTPAWGSPAPSAPVAGWVQQVRGIPAAPRILIIAGPGESRQPRAYAQAVADLAQVLGCPVLAEGLSPLRNFQGLNPYLVTTYDLILRRGDYQQALQPQQVIQLGPLPTSKALRQWLADCQPRRWVIGGCDRNLDPLHGPSQPLPWSLMAIVAALSPIAPAAPSPYCQQWLQLETTVRQKLDQQMATEPSLFEGKVAWLLSQTLPAQTRVFIANSLAVRDVETFWAPSDREIQPFFNRGANGIDGTLSTALGVAHGGGSSVLLTGDLALLHDTNGWLIRPQFRGHLTVVLVNNHGGGIFEMLPIAAFDPPFNPYFTTPQQVNWVALCAAYDVSYEFIPDWDSLSTALNPLPTNGIRLLEVKTDRRAAAQYRKNLRL